MHECLSLVGGKAKWTAEGMQKDRLLLEPLVSGPTQHMADCTVCMLYCGLRGANQPSFGGWIPGFGVRKEPTNPNTFPELRVLDRSGLTAAGYLPVDACAEPF